MVEAVERKYLSVARIAAEHDVSRDSVHHWITEGVCVAGHRVYLRAVRVGWSWRVPVEAWDEFLAACNPGRPAPEESEAAFRRRAERETAEVRARLGKGRKAKGG